MILALAIVIIGWLVIAEPNAQLERLKTSSDLTVLTWFDTVKTYKQVFLAAMAFAGAFWLLIEKSVGLIGLVALIISAVVVAFYLSRLDTRKERIIYDQLGADFPRVLSLLEICLLAGAPLHQAVILVSQIESGPTAALLKQISAEITIGSSQAQAWQHFSSHKVWGEVSRDLSQAVDSGMALTQVLHSHARRAQLDRRKNLICKAKTVGVRSVLPLMCCFLPAFILTGVVPIVAGLLRPILGN